MNKNRKLRDRIRGWFPQEPSSSMTSHQFTQTPMVTQPMTTPPAGAMSLRMAIMIYFPLFLLLSFFVFGVTSFGVNLLVEGITVTAGLAVGLLISLPLTQAELRLLSQRGKVGGLRVGLPIVCFIVILAVVFFPLNYFCPSREVAGVFMDAVWAAFLGEFFSNLLLSLGWEYYTKKRIYLGRGGWWGEAYAITQADKTTFATIDGEAGKG